MRRSKKRATDLNLIAKEISKIEGGAQNLSIAQIKEVLACFGHVMGKRRFMDIATVIHKLLEAGFKKPTKLKLK